MTGSCLANRALPDNVARGFTWPPQRGRSAAAAAAALAAKREGCALCVGAAGSARGQAGKQARPCFVQQVFEVPQMGGGGVVCLKER